MWRYRILGLVLISISFAVSGGAAAEKRVALVIGNSAYKHAPELATRGTMLPTWRPR